MRIGNVGDEPFLVFKKEIEIHVADKILKLLREESPRMLHYIREQCNYLDYHQREDLLRSMEEEHGLIETNDNGEIRITPKGIKVGKKGIKNYNRNWKFWNVYARHVNLIFSIVALLLSIVATILSLYAMIT